LTLIALSVVLTDDVTDDVAASAREGFLTADR